jgi:hypothetical protein
VHPRDTGRLSDSGCKPAVVEETYHLLTLAYKFLCVVEAGVYSFCCVKLNHMSNRPSHLPNGDMDSTVCQFDPQGHCLQNPPGCGELPNDGAGQKQAAPRWAP